MGTQIITEDRLEELKNRSKRCVCKYCGGLLKVRLLDFGQIEMANLELFCEHCNRIEYGTEPEIYHNAVYLVDNIGFNAYPNRTKNEATRKLNIAMVCEIIAWHETQLGILDENGYTVSLDSTKLNLDYEDGSIIVEGQRIE